MEQEDNRNLPLTTVAADRLQHGNKAPLGTLIFFAGVGRLPGRR